MSHFTSQSLFLGSLKSCSKISLTTLSSESRVAMFNGAKKSVVERLQVRDVRDILPSCDHVGDCVPRFPKSIDDGYLCGCSDQVRAAPP